MPVTEPNGDLTETEEEKAARHRQERTTVLECPQCQSHRATILETRPPKARCADCDTTYKIKTAKPTGSLAYDDEAPTTKHRRNDSKDITPARDIDPKEFGILTDYINRALGEGPEGLRTAQRKANSLAAKLGLTYLEPQWFASTPWLLEWAAGNVPMNSHQANGNIAPKPLSPSKNGQSATRQRVRHAIRWRARWLTHFSMGFSICMACRKAGIGESTFYFHQRNDPVFAGQCENAKAHAIDLLHSRVFQRCLEGDIEPIYWQGIKVDHVRKFDGRLQIEMLRAHMPERFKTPGSGPINIDTGDKILVMDEATRAKLIDRRREKMIADRTAREATESEPTP